MLDGGEPVGDHDRRAPAHQLFERRLDQPLGLGVERRGGLVEDQYRRVLEDRPGDRDALPLAARQPDAALADDGGEALRLLPDEVESIRRESRALDLSGRRIRHRAIGNVGGDRVVEEHDLLAHQRDLPPQVGEADRREILSVEQHPPGARQ
jgi:hypothetical protein